MKSATLPSFWTAYASLSKNIKRSARKAYRLWAQNPFHPSLHFKCINHEEDVWSVRITRGYRAVGIFEGDTVTWFWIGGHLSRLFWACAVIKRNPQPIGGGKKRGDTPRTPRVSAAHALSG